MSTSQPITRLFLAIFLLLQAACIGTTPPSRFYLLEPISLDNINEMAGSRLSVSLAPVRIPHYLDRVQIVTATGKNSYQLNELHRWAESLDDNITRVMLQNLTSLVPADVVISRTHRSKQAQVSLAVTILEFHIDSEDHAVLVAQWQVNRGDEIVVNEQNNYRLPVSNDDVHSQVQVLNECLNQFSRDIALALKSLKVS